MFSSTRASFSGDGVERKLVLCICADFPRSPMRSCMGPPQATILGQEDVTSNSNLVERVEPARRRFQAMFWQTQILANAFRQKVLMPGYPSGSSCEDGGRCKAERSFQARSACEEGDAARTAAKPARRVDDDVSECCDMPIAPCAAMPPMIVAAAN
eukprot:2671454-Pleurochrysis_carterae.AAC.3